MPRFDASKYVSVQERINRFWVKHQNGNIVTRLMSPPDDFTTCRYEAAVYRDIQDARPAATGYATESAGASTNDGANYGNHEENCETSAIGRALANMGFATSKDDRPSREEMQKVDRQQQPRNAPQTRSEPQEQIKPAPRTNHIPKTAPMLNETGVILGFYTDIEHAPDDKALRKIGDEIAAAGISDNGLRAAYTKRLTAFAATT